MIFLRFLSIFPIFFLGVYFVLISLKANKNFEIEQVEKKAVYRKIQFMVKLILFFCGVKVSIQDAKSYCKRPLLLVSNHRSYFDVLILINALSQIDPELRLSFVAKVEARKIFYVRILKPFLNILFLDRENIRQALDLFNEAQELITIHKTQLLVFPEGTRNNNPNDLSVIKMSPGAFKVAWVSACPIQPVLITHKYCKKYRFFIRKQNFLVIVMPTLTFEKFSHMKTTQLSLILRNKMNKLISKLNKESEMPSITKNKLVHKSIAKLSRSKKR